MKKLPWSSITSGLVRNFFIFGGSCEAALATIANRSPAGNRRYLMEPSSRVSQRLYSLEVRVTLHRKGRHAINQDSTHEEARQTDPAACAPRFRGRLVRPSRKHRLRRDRPRPY